jgi:hypothetical protein
MKKITTWFKNLSKVAQVSVLATVALSGLFMASAMSPQPQAQTTNQVAPPVATPKAPTMTTKTETETQSIAFTKSSVEDSSLAKGLTTIRVAGVNGVKTLTHTITLSDGVEVSRKTTEATTTEPVTEVTAIGTYVAPPTPPKASNCDPNYSGCVPIASDVDCAGGSGNGPAYVAGPIRVIGSDIYGLDRDGDGIGCE